MERRKGSLIVLSVLLSCKHRSFSVLLALFRITQRFALVPLMAMILPAQQASPPPGWPAKPPAPDSSVNGISGEAPPPVSCPAGAPLGSVDLRVETAGQINSLPFQTINHLTEGDKVLYSPVLRGREKRPGEVSLVMVPAHRQPKEAPLVVTDPKPADKQEEWRIPRTVSLAALVYGPQGLSKKKVAGFLSQDDLLIAQLADYAEKTAQTEALMEALSNAGSSSASVNSALTGFASQYGMAVQIDKTAPPAAQAQALFSAMNPQLAAYNPLSSSTAQRVGQTASVATAAATLFFGSPIGLAAGGTAMLLDLRYIAFPGMQFRASFAQPLPPAVKKDGLSLCGQNTPAPPHTRVAFIWAVRIPNIPAPAIQVGKANYVPAGLKTPLPVDVPDAQWKYLQRAHGWSLENGKGEKCKVGVLKLGNQKAIELDLSKTAVAPGNYHLSALWDWAAFEASGDIHVKQLSTFESAKVQPASQDRLLAKAGKIPVTLVDSDFEFLTKAEIKKSNDEFAVSEPVRFVLPQGLREGPQMKADVQIDTASLDAGKYELLLLQQDGKSHSVPVRLLPNLPRISNLPILANQGETAQHYVLKGERLNLVSKLSAPGVTFSLGDASEDGTDRSVTVQLQSSVQPGSKLPIEASIADRSEPVTLPGALEITGPLPAIASSHLSLPSGMAIALPPNEFPAGYNLTAMLDVRNVRATNLVKLGCSEDVAEPVSLRIGEQNSRYSLQQLSSDQLFLSVDTSGFPAGCALEATIVGQESGQSKPFTLARIVRVPAIESFTPADSPPLDGKREYKLTGKSLEMIERVGWDQASGTSLSGLPAPILGEGQKQELTVTLPDPPPANGALYIWLRGSKAATVTKWTAAPDAAAQTKTPATAAPLGPH